MDINETLKKMQQRYPQLNLEVLRGQFVVQVLNCQDCGKIIKTSQIDSFGNDICDECTTKRAEARRAKTASTYARDVSRCEYHDETDGCGTR